MIKFNKIEILFLVLLFVGSCTRQKSNNLAGLPDQCVQKDTITTFGTKIHYNYIDGKIKISWSNKYFYRTYDSSFSCSVEKDSTLWDLVPKFEYESKNYLILKNILTTSSGGNPAPLDYYVIILPKNAYEKPFEKYYYLQSGFNLLIWLDDDNYSIIHTLNLETNKIKDLILSPKPLLTRSPSLGIRKIDITNKTIKINYETLDKNDEIVLFENTFLND